jgi:hypothetical protein
MRRIGIKKLAPIRARLLQLQAMREKYGVLLQDFECKKGEAFYANMTPAQFEELPLGSKRKGNAAYIVRLFSEPAKGDLEAKDAHKIVRMTYEEAYGDKESIGVFVLTQELIDRNIEH